MKKGKSVYVCVCVCVNEMSGRRALKLPLSTLSIELLIPHASGLFLLLKNPSSQCEPPFTPKPDCHSISSSASLYVFVSPCFPSCSSQSLCLCLSGGGRGAAHCCTGENGDRLRGGEEKENKTEG
ncbi:hypothetical protein CHARACLAT_000721 [Characodon lateralis]|uniref:Uncharacterized protein n=1 Tax=Characodon lateralis TaxID=208331 RepID=A0ABU7E6I2_9TELE|nr:hypothetical protein [Characodon lateralis]